MAIATLRRPCVPPRTSSARVPTTSSIPAGVTTIAGKDLCRDWRARGLSMGQAAAGTTTTATMPRRSHRKRPRRAERAVTAQASPFKSWYERAAARRTLASTTTTGCATSTTIPCRGLQERPRPAEPDRVQNSRDRNGRLGIRESRGHDLPSQHGLQHGSDRGGEVRSVWHWHLTRTYRGDPAYGGVRRTGWAHCSR